VRLPPTGARVMGALLVGAVAISFAAPFFRLAAPIDPLLASAVRLALAALLLAPALPRARRAGRLGSRALRAGVIAGALYALHFGTWVASLGMTSVAASVTLVTATPLLLAILGWLSRTDAPTSRLWLGIALATAGTALIGAADASGPDGALLGDVLALLGALAMAAYLVVARREQAAIEPVSFSAIAAGSGALFLAVVIAVRAAILGELPSTPTLPSLGWVAMTALISQLVGHTALTWALRHASPTLVALATTAEPVIASVITLLWLGELPAMLVIVGSAITLCGVVVGMTGRAPASDPSASISPRG